MECPECKGSNIVKNGKPCGKQRYLCKACGKVFVEREKGKSFLTKLSALLLYHSKYDMTDLSEFFQVSKSAICHWNDLLNKTSKYFEPIIKKNMRSERNRKAQDAKELQLKYGGDRYIVIELDSSGEIVGVDCYHSEKNKAEPD